MLREHQVLAPVLRRRIRCTSSTAKHAKAPRQQLRMRPGEVCWAAAKCAKAVFGGEHTLQLRRKHGRIDVEDIAVKLRSAICIGCSRWPTIVPQSFAAERPAGSLPGICPALFAKSPCQATSCRHSRSRLIHSSSQRSAHCSGRSSPAPASRRHGARVSAGVRLSRDLAHTISSDVVRRPAGRRSGSMWNAATPARSNSSDVGCANDLRRY